jgi:hypothetical protein
LKDVVFWKMTPCGCHKKTQCFGWTCRLYLQSNETLSLAVDSALWSSMEFLYVVASQDKFDEATAHQQ